MIPLRWTFFPSIRFCHAWHLNLLVHSSNLTSPPLKMTATKKFKKRRRGAGNNSSTCTLSLFLSLSVREAEQERIMACIPPNSKRVGYIVPIHVPLDRPLYMGSIYTNTPHSLNYRRSGVQDWTTRKLTPPRSLNNRRSGVQDWTRREYKESTKG